MALTYDPIQTTTVGTATNSITFSSIPATYTDLRVTIVCQPTAGGGVYKMRYNGVSSSTYSYIEYYTAGATLSVGNYGANGVDFNGSFGSSNAQPNFLTADIMNYAGSTYKTAICRMSMDLNGSGFTYHVLNCWRSTAAINSLTFSLDAGNYSVGTVITIYGIKAA
jgi:hypothetical protein